MNKLFVILALNVALFARYEAVRQGFLKNSLPAVQKQASALAAEAEKAKLGTVAEFAQSVALAKNLTDARRSFGALSDEMIKVPGHPAVYYCPMAGKSWLQKKGKVGNPYEPDMVTCGSLKTE